MSSEVKIEVTKEHGRNILKLMQSEGMKNILEAKAQEIADRCGSGYASDTKLMGTRWIASAYTATEEAMQDNLQNNTLMKGIK